jgi:hypothetical protein
MTEGNNVRFRGVNKGIFVGHSVQDSTLTVGSSGAAGEETADSGDDEALRRLEELVSALLERLPGQLPSEQATAVKEDVERLRTELAAPERDGNRLRSILGKLGSAVAAAAPLAELVKNITDLITGLLH